MSYFVDDNDIPGRDRRYHSIKRFGRGGVGIVDFHEDDPEEEEVIQYCPHCLEYDFHVKLGVRMLKKGEPVPPDHDQWLQCHDCGNIYGVHEIENQKKLQVNELKGHVVDNPFEANQTLTESIPKRTTAAGRKATTKRKKERNRQHHKDIEIDTLLRIYGSDNVHIVEDSDP